MRRLLVGFLPSVDTATMSMAVMPAAPTSMASPSPSAASQPARNNHAIWDQIALLHWLKHNVAHFQGDPRNVTLLATGGAARYVQLLALSPLAKGLFSHVILGQASDGDKSATLSQLLRYASEARETRRKLMSNLSAIVQKQLAATQPDLSSEQQVAQYLQAANLSQLAQLDCELELLNSDAQLALARGPTLDDKLLFPHLSRLIRQRAFDLPTSFANFTRRKAQLNFCSYLSHLNTSKADFLGLVSSRSSATAKLSPEQHRSFKSSNELQLETSSWVFNHLMNIHSIDEILTQSAVDFLADDLTSSDEQVSNVESSDEEEEEDEDANILRRQHDRSVLLQISAPAGVSKRSASIDTFGERIGSDLDELMSVMSSFDLMVGVSRSRATARASEETAEQRGLRSKDKPANFTNVIVAIVNITNSRSNLEEDYYDLINFADLHSLASNVNGDDDKTTNYCDYSRSRSTLLFKIPETSEKSSSMESNLERDAQLSREISSFIRSNPNDHRDNETQWQQYEPLHRIVNSLNATKSWQPKGTLNPKITTRLDVIPYFKQISETLTSPQVEGRPQVAFNSLMNCLIELESTFSNMILSADTHELLVDRIQKEAKCLRSSMAKFRGQLKQVAWPALEPLISRIQQLNKQVDLQDQPSSWKSGDDLQLVASSNSESPSTSTNNSMVLVARDNSQRVTVQRNSSRAASSSPSDTGGGLRGFLAKAYRDAMGQLLAVVVGTGLFIVLLNLVIVVVITLRSARERRRLARTVQDSSSSDGNQPQQSRLIEAQCTDHLQPAAPAAVIKSTLKKQRPANGLQVSQQSPPRDYSQETELTPSTSISKSVNFNLNGQQQQPHKRLQFDLSGIPSHRADEMETYERREPHAQQVVLLDVNNLQAENEDHANEEMNELLTFKIPNHSLILSNDLNQHYGCTSLSSPFASISGHSSSQSNVTVGSPSHLDPQSYSVFMQPPGGRHRQSITRHANSAPHHNQLMNQLSSPGGSTMNSTSHSMTPIQLESFAVATSAGAAAASPDGRAGEHNYHLESIGLIYAPAATFEQLNSSGSNFQLQLANEPLASFQFQDSSPEKRVMMLSQQHEYQCNHTEG